jgi:hypothetical protein
VRWLDFSKPAGTVPPISWAEVAFREFQEFKDALARALDKYALFLEPELVTTIERLVTAGLVNYAAGFRTLVSLRVHPGFFAHSTASQVVLKYILDFASLAEQFNLVESDTGLRIVPSEEIWRIDVAPAVGSARMANVPE